MTPTFNMKHLSDKLAERFGLTHQLSAEVVRFAFDTIKQELAQGKQVRLHQFGTLEARHRKAGVARNPANGERITVPERRVVKLTPSPALKAMVAQ